MSCTHQRYETLETRPRSCIRLPSGQYQIECRYRRKRCLECGKRFYTYEVTAEQLEEFFKQFEKANQMLRNFAQASEAWEEIKGKISSQ